MQLIYPRHGHDLLELDVCHRVIRSVGKGRTGERVLWTQLYSVVDRAPLKMIYLE